MFIMDILKDRVRCEFQYLDRVRVGIQQWIGLGLRFSNG